MTIRHDSTDPEKLSRARRLRRESTFPERKLWVALRGRRLAGYKFRRQAPIGSFIVDFLHNASKLIIELDGRSHDDRGSEDRSRQLWLENQGFRVLRFSNDDVLLDIQGVLEAIERILSPHPDQNPGERQADTRHLLPRVKTSPPSSTQTPIPHSPRIEGPPE